jgi:hypothetical protein
VAVVGICLFAQDPPKSAPTQEEQASMTRGMPARATPADYQSHGDAEKVRIGAEFFQHTVPSPQGSLNNEDFIVVEAGLFGPTGAHLVISPLDFSLRLNQKKNPLASAPYELVFKSLKDPEWEPPELANADPKAGKTSIGSSGAGKSGLSTGGGGEPPPVIHVPIKLQRDWEARVKKQAFPEGDRTLPQAGLLFFGYRSKATSIHSLELIYSGPGGKAVIELTP